MDEDSKENVSQLLSDMVKTNRETCYLQQQNEEQMENDDPLLVAIES